MLEDKTLVSQIGLGEGLDKVNDFLENLIVEQGLPGCSAAVVFDQEIIWSKGFGFADLEKKTPSTTQTLYRVGSITKLFTATMLMQLRDAGKLQLDDPIEKYLPAFKLKSRFANTRPPTFREVVAHLGGIPREAPLDYWYTQKFPTIEDIMASLDQTELILPPMSEFKYSNLGIAVLGHALETIAGQPYRDYVKQNILEPLGMQASDFELNSETEKQMATGYALEPGQAPQAVGRPSISGFIYAGQLISSVSEMAAFISLQFRPAGAIAEQFARNARPGLYQPGLEDRQRHRLGAGTPGRLYRHRARRQRDGL
jgi:CubicO group peptidase (beta-lactamase class C family)